MARKLVVISITYCAECGYEEPCLKAARRLMEEFHMYLKQVVLIPAANGELEVEVDGELIHSTKTSGQFPKADALVEAVRARIDG